MGTRLVLALLVLAVALPPAAGATADQIIDVYEDVPTPWAFVDPCEGDALHGLGTESGIARVTELGDRGEHVRVNAGGVVDLHNDDGELVGTWTYTLKLVNQIPPDEQGALIGRVAGPLEYTDGSTAFVTLRLQFVFAKGGSPKRAVESSACVH
ncbi:MAG TPA: hypothetical protein VFN99_02710 [Gaiella sp.]|nr:hypothetical protein [Gaiella sp.]